MRVSRLLALVIGTAIIVAIGLEMGARLVLGYKPLRFSRPYDPIFVSGDFFEAMSRRELEKNATNGPAKYNYRPIGSEQYQWNGQVMATSLTSLSDFLFDHYLSRYTSREVDNIICRQSDSLAIYVLGGSNAQGSSASSRETSWHALLEKMLRKNLRRNDVYVFNGAMGGFVSFQERLAYHLAAFPRGARFVIIVDGPNDLLASAGGVNRPGDPDNIGTRFGQFYGSPLSSWLTEHSALVNGLVQATLGKSILKYRTKLSEQDDFFDLAANSGVNLYVENVSAILKDCAATETTCLVGIHPTRQLSSAYMGLRETRADDILPQDRVRQLYSVLFKQISASQYYQNFIDLTHFIKTEKELEYYTDTVHTDDRGQLLLAEALIAPIESAIRATKIKSVNKPIISCDAISPK
jgi:hypothetical protein